MGDILINHIKHQINPIESEFGDYSANQACPPKKIYFPKNTIECQQLLKWANHHQVEVTIRGAGTGTTGGAISITKNQIIVSLKEMNKVIDFDLENATLTVEPGVVLADIHQLVEDQGLFYPPDPASLTKCTIGGNVSENAGGPRALKYGVTRDYVIGLSGVWANGELFNYGGKIKKNVAGYDMIGLLVGSEGTLGIVTEIILKLRPKPKVIKEAIASYNSSDDALQALNQTLTSGVAPSTAEFMVKQCVTASLEYLGIRAQFDQHNAYVIWQVDGFTNHEVEAQMDQIEKMSQTSAFLKMDSKEMSEHVWSIRRHVSLGLKKIAGKKFSEDIVVPIARVPDIIKELESMTHSSGIQVLGYGHLGDGNIHVNILKMTASDQDWVEHTPQIIKKVMQLAVDYGGSISGEHGIGLSKKQFMPMMFSDHDLELMKKIKYQVDPKSILNPGKLHP